MTVEEYRQMMTNKDKKPKRIIKEDFIDHTPAVDIIKMYGLDPDRSVYIRGHVYSSKNSKRIMTRFPKEGQTTQWTCKGKKVIPFIGDSEGVEAYRKATWYMYKDLAAMFHQKTRGVGLPFVLQFTFIRMDNQGFDFPNIVQLVLDLMVYYKWMKDDEIKFVLPVPPLPPKPSHFVSDKHAGVIITIL